MLCIPLDFLNGWLFGVNASRVKESIRERLITYQRECYRVLADAFLGPEAREVAVSPTEVSLYQVREMGLAIARMAEEQIVFERRLTTTEGRLEKAAVVYGDLTKRVETLEQRMGPGQPVTEDQASQISQAVKAVAMTLSKTSGSNQYGSVYGELYRKFGITSYKLLPARRFNEAMEFLTEWNIKEYFCLLEPERGLPKIKFIIKNEVIPSLFDIITDASGIVFCILSG